jgi:hypothetical protein
MIDMQTEEAERHLRGGDIPAAIGCWQAVVELGGDDIDATAAREMLARHAGASTDHEKLLAGLDAIAPVEEIPQEEGEAGEEYYGDDPGEIFEVYLQTLPEKQAEAYRTLGEPFRDGFLLIQEGKAREALERFAAAGEAQEVQPYFRLERAQALLLDEQSVEALRDLDAMEIPEEVRRRVAEMRTILLERLGRHEDAEAEAARIWEQDKDADAAILYGELLVDHSRFDRALEIVKPFVHPGRPQPDVDRLAARAYAGTGKTREARDLLERAVESYFQGPVGMRDAPQFPLWAVRELLALYVAQKEEPEKVRSLVQHLIRHDPASAESYKGILAEYARDRRDEGTAGAADAAGAGQPPRSP